MRCRQLIALIMVCAYLLIPLDALASPHSPCSSFHRSGSLVDISPAKEGSSHSPASSHDDFDRCNSACSCCSCCSFFLPVSSEIPFVATATPLAMLEPVQRFPEVYRSIFVPPQNLLARFSRSKTVYTQA